MLNTEPSPQNREDSQSAMEIVLNADKSIQPLFAHSKKLYPGELHFAAINALHSWGIIPPGYYTTEELTIHIEHKIVQELLNVIKADPEAFINGILSADSSIDAPELRAAVENCANISWCESNISFRRTPDNTIDIGGIIIPIVCLQRFMPNSELKLLTCEFEFQGITYVLKDIFRVSMDEKQRQYTLDLYDWKSTPPKFMTKKPVPVQDMWKKPQNKEKVGSFSFGKNLMLHLYRYVMAIGKKVDFLYYVPGEDFLWFNQGEERYYFFLNSKDLIAINMRFTLPQHIIPIPFQWFTRLQSEVNAFIYHDEGNYLIELRKGKKHYNYRYLPIIENSSMVTEIKEQVRRVRRCLGIPDLLDLDNCQ